MAFSTWSAHIRVLDKSNKTKFSHFIVENFPTCTMPEEVKSFLLKEHPQILSPTTDINFKLGYFVEGRGNRKFDIVDENTLQQAYDKATNRRITFWVDPHTPLVPVPGKRARNTGELFNVFSKATCFSILKTKVTYKTNTLR